MKPGGEETALVVFSMFSIQNNIDFIIVLMIDDSFYALAWFAVGSCVEVFAVWTFRISQKKQTIAKLWNELGNS